MASDLGELMSLSSASDNRPVINNSLACYADKAYKNAMIAHNTVVRHMDIGHKQCVAANLRHALAAGLGATVDRHTLADGDIVADLHVCDLTLIFKILRDGAYHSTWEYLAILSHLDV